MRMKRVSQGRLIERKAAEGLSNSQLRRLVHEAQPAWLNIGRWLCCSGDSAALEVCKAWHEHVRAELQTPEAAAQWVLQIVCKGDIQRAVVTAAACQWVLAPFTTAVATAMVLHLLGIADVADQDRTWCAAARAAGEVGQKSMFRALAAAQASQPHLVYQMCKAAAKGAAATGRAALAQDIIGGASLPLAYSTPEHRHALAVCAVIAAAKDNELTAWRELYAWQEARVGQVQVAVGVPEGEPALTGDQLADMLESVAQSGSIEVYHEFDAWISDFGLPLSACDGQRAVEAAVQDGDFSMVEELVSEGACIDVGYVQDLLTYLVREGVAVGAVAACVGRLQSETGDDSLKDVHDAVIAAVSKGYSKLDKQAVLPALTEFYTALEWPSIHLDMELETQAPKGLSFVCEALVEAGADQNVQHCLVEEAVEASS